jgi:hypothetical protein
MYFSTWEKEAGGRGWVERVSWNQALRMRIRVEFRLK